MLVTSISRTSGYYVIQVDLLASATALQESESLTQLSVQRSGELLPLTHPISNDPN